MKTTDNKEYLVDRTPHNGFCENCKAPRGPRQGVVVVRYAGEAPRFAEADNKYCKVCMEMLLVVGGRQWFVQAQREWQEEQKKLRNLGLGGDYVA
jgi:hypothetical protein